MHACCMHINACKLLHVGCNVHVDVCMFVMHVSMGLRVDTCSLFSADHFFPIVFSLEGVEWMDVEY